MNNGENWSPHLKFNSKSRLDSKNLATHFDPANQPPVVVQKLGSVDTVGLSKTPRNAFRAVDPERLAYAVELARRNVHRTRRSYAEVTPTSSTVEELPVQNPKTSGSTAVPLLQTQKESSLKRPHRKRRGSGEVEKRDMARDQIGKLNAELQRRLLMISKDNDREFTGNGRRRNNRLRWEREDEEEDKEKLERWRREQQARNARMMYDLSQQVKDLERRIGKIQECDSGISQQGEIVKKLAAAQRAALRTLQTFGGSRGGAGGSIPPELSLLIQQLALLSTQLGGEGGGGGGSTGSDITASVLQLVKTMEERQRIARLNRQEMEMRAQDISAGDFAGSIPVQRKKMKDGRAVNMVQPSRVGLLLDPQLQRKRAKSRVQPKKTHYTQGTFNSLRRQQPPVECAVSFSSPAHAQSSALNSSVIRPCQVALSLSPGQEKRNKEVRGNVASVTSRPQRNFKHKQIVIPAETEDPLDDGSVCDESGTHSETAPKEGSGTTSTDLTTVIRQQTEQMTLLRNDIAHKLAELKTDLGRQSGDTQEKMNRDAKPLESHVALASGDPVSVPPVSNDPTSDHSVSNTPVCNNSNGPVLFSGTVSNSMQVPAGVPSNVPERVPMPGVRDCSLMLRRLDELEAEENEISRRWTSIVYEDLGSTKLSYRKHSDRKAPPSITPTSVRVSAPDREELYNYKERYSQYLDSTGVSTRGGFNPWDMAESIADALVDDLVEGVAGEVGQVCDGCVESVYSSEFKRPP